MTTLVMATYQEVLVDVCENVLRDQTLELEFVRSACPYDFRFQKTLPPIPRREKTIRARVLNRIDRWRHAFRFEMDEEPSLDFQQRVYSLVFYYHRIVWLVNRLEIPAALRHRGLLLECQSLLRTMRRCRQLHRFEYLMEKFERALKSFVVAITRR